MGPFLCAAENRVSGGTPINPVVPEVRIADVSQALRAAAPVQRQLAAVSA